MSTALPNVVPLGALADSDLLTTDTLRALFSCSGKTVARMIRRDELPAPMRFRGRYTWTAGALRAHNARRLAAAAEEQASDNDRTARLRAKHGA